MKDINITRKLKYINSHQSDLSTTMISRKVNQLSNYLHKIDLNSFFHTINLMEIEKKEPVTKVLKEFKKKEVLVSPTEEKFLNYILENVNIDLTEEEKELFITKVMEKIIIPLHDKYMRSLLEQGVVFSADFWKKHAKNNSFIEFISTLYFYKHKYPFYIYSKYGEMLNHLESLSLAKEEIPELVPIYNKIMNQVFNYSKQDSYEYFIAYPLNINWGRKDFLAEYIMKTPKDKFHPKAKEYFLKKNPHSGFTLAILSSDKFTEEEKLSVINRLNRYQEIPKEKRKYFEHTYDEILNNAYVRATFAMISHTKDEIIAIDTRKLYDLEAQEQRQLLEQIIEEDKLHNLYYPYYYSWPTPIHDGKMKEEIKKLYIDNFTSLTNFLKQEEKIHSFSLVRTGTMYKDEEHFQKKRFEKDEGLDTVILQEEKVLQKKKRWTDVFSKKKKNRL